MYRKLAALFVLLTFTLVLTGSTFAKKGSDLPSFPDDDILNQVINETGGPTYTALGVPNTLVRHLKKFKGVFNGAENLFNANQTVHYLRTDASLAETVLPLLNNGGAVLAPDITTPGQNPAPGKIIGATWQRGRNTLLVVAVFNSDDGGKPKKVRFYRKNNEYYETKAIWGKFEDEDGNSVLPSIDEGSLLTHQLSCVTVGLEQVCWKPYDDTALREGNTANEVVEDAYKRFKKAYKIKGAKFYTKDSVPDLIGPTRRLACAAQLSLAANFDVLSACEPNLIFAAAETKQPDAPIGLFVVLEQADLKAYTYEGDYLGYLPAGEYLVMDATPDNTPGQVGVLMLVNIDKQNHYLIPSIAMQGFGTSGNPISTALKKSTASIKDGAMWYRGF